MNTKILKTLAACVLTSWIAAPAAHAELEAQMYVITHWDQDCSGSTVSHWDEMVDEWYDKMGDKGTYSKDRRKVNGTFDRDLLCDPDTGLANCNDGSYLDDGDAVMIGLHGSDSGNSWEGLLRHDGGSSVNDCRITAPDGSGSDEELRVGDLDTEYLHLSSCYSADDDNMPDTWLIFYDPVDTPMNDRRLHVLTGFHGIMAIGSSLDADYRRFARDAHSDSIGDAWMDHMYRSSIRYSGRNGTHEQCPVAYSVGTSGSNCLSRLDNEGYRNRWSDPSAINSYCYTYIEGCDPLGENPFTPPS